MNSHLCCGHSTAPLAVPLDKAHLEAAGLMSSAGTTWETKLKQNRGYQPVKMPGKGVGLANLGNGTVACDTVCVSPQKRISPLFGLKDLVMWRKLVYLHGSMKSQFPAQQDTPTSDLHSHEYMFLRNYRFF